MILVVLAAVLQDESPKSTLPAVRRVTVKLTDVPAPQALEAFATAAGFDVRYQAQWRDETGMDDRPCSLEMKDTPFVDAIGEFCRAHGGLSFSLDAIGPVVTDGANASPVFASDLFGFAVTRIEGRLSTDFSEAHRSLSIDLSLWWQPDLTVFKVNGVSIDEAVDDAGTDLRLEGAKHRLDGIHKAQLTLALPARAATSLAAFRGSVDFEVPGDVVEVSLTDIAAESFGPIKAGDYVVTGTRSETDDGPTWVVVVEADGRTVAGLTETRVVRADGMRPKPGQWACSDGKKAWFKDVVGGDVTALSFKIVTSKARLKVPFEFKAVKLPRTK